MSIAAMEVRSKKLEVRRSKSSNFQLPTSKFLHCPLTTVGATEHQQPAPSADRVECPICGKSYAGGAIVNAKPEPNFEWCCLSVTRRCYCDHCNVVIIWREQCDINGRTCGTVLGEPGILKKHETIERFLRDHPQAAGVAQC